MLDEATSALDNLTEERITRTIDSPRGDMTILVVAHRLSTVKHADQLMFMADGRIARAPLPSCCGTARSSLTSWSWGSSREPPRPPARHGEPRPCPEAGAPARRGLLLREVVAAARPRRAPHGHRPGLAARCGEPHPSAHRPAHRRGALPGKGGVRLEQRNKRPARAWPSRGRPSSAESEQALRAWSPRRTRGGPAVGGARRSRRPGAPR
ncbi:hypothetical protein QJS66_07660 [Kocuria rhizophila]|nr:hypothetical protein QJS66_07660 [Kocuria rhizophila]